MDFRKATSIFFTSSLFSSFSVHSMEIEEPVTWIEELHGTYLEFHSVEGRTEVSEK
jgi:hypothetical protein